MKSAAAISGRRLWGGFVPPVVLSAVVVGALWTSFVSMPTLRAQSGGAGSPPSNLDADGDGLTFEEEMVLGTSPVKRDSDRDGFSDLEEVARKSSPTWFASKPSPTQVLSVGMTAAASTNGVHALVAVYMTDTNLRNKQLKVGFFARGHVVYLSTSYLAMHSTTSFHAASNANGCVAVVDLTIDPQLINSLGELSVFATAAMPSLPGSCESPASAAMLHFLSIGGVPVYCMPNPRPQTSQSQAQSGTQTTIYVPLIPNPQGGSGGGAGGGAGGGSTGGSVPSTWSAGEVCFQRSAPVASNGAVVTSEVITANCVNGWDGFCPPSCTSTVGSTYQTIDPLVLIGG